MNQQHIVRGTPSAAFCKQQEKQIIWPLDDGITNAELEEILFPGKYKNGCRYVEPDYPYIHRELAKPGVTMALLWEEYCWKCHESGETPYMSTQFGDKYRRWARVTIATMRIQHKPGDAVQVDWAGDTLPVYDPITGEQRPAYLFVAAWSVAKVPNDYLVSDGRNKYSVCIKYQRRQIIRWRNILLSCLGICLHPKGHICMS